MNLLATIALGLLNAATVLLAAPLGEGLLRKLTARIQSRQGPPLLQPYYDLLKLLCKEDLEAGQVPSMQRFAACLAFAAVVAVAWLVPMGAPAPLNAHADVVLLIYLLSLCSISTLLAGLAAGSTFSLLGISREMMAMVALEPLLAVALVVGAVHEKSLRLEAVLSGSVYGAAGFPWSGLLTLLAVLLAFQAFVQRAPFDMAEAETELMEGPLLEYSGPKLALFKYARQAKLMVYCALFVALFAPWGLGLGQPLAWLWFWAKVGVLVLLVTAIAATHARYRIDQALRYLGGLLGVALAALVLATFGY